MKTPDSRSREGEIDFEDIVPRVQALVGGIIWSDVTSGVLPHRMYLAKELESRTSYGEKSDFLRNYLYLCAGVLESIIGDKYFPPAPKALNTEVYRALLAFIKQLFPDAPAKFLEYYKFNYPEKFES